MGIRQTLNKSLLLPVFSLMLVGLVLMSVFSYRSANARLEQRVQNLANGSAVLFEDLLWQMDHSTLQMLLDDQVKLGAITAATITSGSRLTLQAGSITDDMPVYTYSRNLLRTESHSSSKIGTLTFQMSRAGVLAQLRHQLLGTLLIALVAVLATVLIIQRLLEGRLISPFMKIADSLENWNGNWQDFKIDLDRKSHAEGHHDDELDRLVKSIHGMRDQILTANRMVESQESRLLSAAKVAGIGYASYKPETGLYVDCDDNFASMLGYTAQEVMENKLSMASVYSRIHPEDTHIADKIKDEMCAGAKLAEGTLRIARPSGEYRYIRQLFKNDSSSAIDKIVDIVADDVTEIHQLQSTLAQAQKVKAIGNLTGGVAHDFNNILAIISGNLELLENEANSPLASKFINTSLDAVQHGAELTHQLLAFARKQPLRPKVVSAANLVKNSQSLLKTSVGESIDLSISLDDGVWHLEVDVTQLEAALLNLVVNARDAMPDGGELDIEVVNAQLDIDYTSQHDELIPGDYVCIAISDSGHGMSMETMARAMEPFYSTKDVGRGTGLGLAMVYGFAKQSGGHLKLYSELGYGTTIRLYLPRVLPNKKTGPEQFPIPSPLEELQGLHVFLVEDDNSLRLTFNKQLENLGCTVHAASNGPDAFSLAERVAHIDLVLCDVILPGGMKGPQVVAGLLGHFKGAAVVYMSGYTENSIIHQGRLMEGVTMLEKPFSMSELATAYQSAVRILVK